MANLKLVGVDKIYDNGVQAVFNFNIDISDKEFIVFVGPSGCGKSTTLRMIAGLEEISAGEFYIDDVLMNDVPPKDRDIAMVFQSYALYPHMSVYENMAFSLKLKKTPREEIERRVKEAAEILGLENYLDRKPKALSGGQRQRVALGRAIVRNPKVFLMDEPLSNLDAKLRVQMRSQIIKIHERVGATTIYVTHDQTEAMTMASRIVVMKDGYIQQIGAPKDLYNHPANMFVAGFIGSPAMNFLRGHVETKLGDFRLDGDGNADIHLNEEILGKLGTNTENLVLGIRPEHLDFIEKGTTTDKPTLTFEADVVELLGDVLNIHGTVNGQNIIVKTSSLYDVRMHDMVTVAVNLDKVHFFDAETQKVIAGF